MGGGPGLGPAPPSFGVLFSVSEQRESAPNYGLMTPTLGDSGAASGLPSLRSRPPAEFAGRPFVAEALRSELAALEAQEPEKDAFAADEEFRRAYTAGIRATRSCMTRRRRARCSSASRDAAVRR
jgi:hypothetical protein